jgi:hypothetical protein
MNKWIHVLIAIGISMHLVGCDNKEEYSLTKDDALKVNSANASERVDSFGAEGPYRWTCSSGFPRGCGVWAWATVGGQQIKKEYARPHAGDWYVIEQFENSRKEGYAVVYKHTSKER